MQKDSEEGRTDITGVKTSRIQQLHAHKRGTPIGGGILVMLITLIGYFILYKFLSLDEDKSVLLLFAFLAFGLFGLYDDVRKIIPGKRGLYHIKARDQLIIQLVIAGVISYFGTKLNLFTIDIPYFLTITNPIVTMAISTLTIVFFTNAFNLTDGLDGMGTGLLLINLVALGIIFYLKTAAPELMFISILGGSVLGYFYYNIYPARLFNGDSGTFAIGAAYIVLLLMNNLFYIVPILGFVYIVEALSSLSQGISKKYFGKRLFEIAPLHHHFEMIGWHETKVTMRFWMINTFFTILSLAVYLSIN